MPKICPHKCVGIFVWKDEKLLLIERGQFPWGFAVPAGHVDGEDTFEETAEKELKEEVGLNAEKLELLAEGRRENMCRRKDGTWHFWKVYKAETSGEILGSERETKQVNWYSVEQIKELTEKTEKYLAKEISEEEWQKSPGLEPIMLEWFKELKII